ncbi:hypothetical protein NQ315_009145 [Exocentrus adspersus]|uniref:Uncharacterized protein n=1 Tax=Exocentrus adspersus TaxID=1586481 RepID=A0AAV8WEZ1_9CUCU|nr:hypothetical protein NQ315_009145 [Exocentrus adspersus]
MSENKELDKGPIIMELQESDLTEMISINVICRLCANQNDKLIGIYSEDGLTNDLANKLNMYLPIKVNENDDLPLQCCWQCASTVLAWHDLVVTSVEADRRLRSYQFVTEKQLCDAKLNFQSEESCHSENQQDEAEPDHASNAFCQADADITIQNTTEKVDKSLKQSLEPDYSVSNNENLSDFVNIEQQYLQLNNDIYDIKIEDKALQAKQNLELPQLYQNVDDSLNDTVSKEVSVEETQRVRKRESEEVEGYLYYEDSGDEESNFLEKETTVQKIETTQGNSDLQIIPKIPLRENKTTCSLCCKVLDNMVLLNKHMKNVHNIKSQKYRRRKNEIDATFTCPTCKKCYTRKFDMEKHVKNKHPDQKRDMLPSSRAKNMGILTRCRIISSEGSFYKCDICGHSFKKSHNFVRHRNIHTSEKSFFCHICGKKFVVSGSLTRHINQHHYGIKNFGCTICGRKFSAKATRDEHMNIHNNLRPFVCDVCGKSFKQNSSLHIHKVFHTDNFPFPCQVCDKKFRRKRDLTVHLWKHTGGKPHPCKQCTKSFKHEQDLRRHSKIHTGYFCDICGLTFQQERFLKNHSKIHETPE